MKGVPLFFGKTANLFKEAFSEWRNDNASLLAAAIAYYAAFSLAPLAIVTIVFSGLLLGPPEHAGGLERRLSGFLGAEVASAVEGIIRNATSPAPSLFAAAAASVFLFFGTTGLFLQTRRGLNVIWEVKPDVGGAIKNALKSYLLSFIQLIIAGLIVLLSEVLTVALASAGRFFRDVLPYNLSLLHAMNFSIFFIAVCVIFASTYKTLSGVRLLWGDVLYGSAFTAALFSAGNLIIGLYLGVADIGSVYGAASSLFIILFWVYYSAQIFFFGAELIKVYARKYGSHKRV